MATHKKVKNNTAYMDVVFNDTINNLSEKCNNFRKASEIIDKDPLYFYLRQENIDNLYQKLFDEVLDSLLICHDTHVIDMAMKGLKMGLDMKRGIIKRN